MAHDIDHIDPVAETTQPDEKRPFPWLALTTGLNAALAISYLACKPPHAHTLSLKTRLLTSVLFLLITCLAGSAGIWVALSRDSRKQFRSLALWAMRLWVFLPAIMIFLQERSIWAPLIAVVSTALMAARLPRLTDPTTDRSSKAVKQHNDVEKNIFITQLRFEPISWPPFGISLCLYGSLTSAITGRMALSTLFLAAASFLVVLQIAAAQPQSKNELKNKKNKQTQSSRPYSLVATAFLCVFVALSVSANQSSVRWNRRFFQGPPQSHAKKQTAGDKSSQGYRAIVLWPVLKKEKVILSPPQQGTFASVAPRPWVIPFFGPYWYFKIDGESPGPSARTTRGDPLKVNVRSTDDGPLLMEAHQNLSDPIDLACCRAIQVVFRNDASLGASEIGLTLTDSSSKSRSSQSLGIKSIAQDADPALENTSPVEQTVSFPLPRSGSIKSFDRITVVLLPRHRYSTSGRRVAIERFIMIPN